MNSSWNKDWLEAQRQYLEALAAFSTTVTQNQAAAAQTPEWQKMLDNWWQTRLSGIPEDSQVVFSDLLQHSHSWYGITEQFNELLRTISDSDDKTSDWQTVLAEQFDKMNTQLQDGFAGVDNNIWQGGLQSPMHSWQNMINTISSGTGAESPHFLFSNLQTSFEKYFSLPGPGQNRQTQEQIQEGLGLWQAYQKNYQAYRETLNKIALSSLDRLHEKILALADQEKSISSIRDLYDLWVDSHEEAYSAFVLTEEYSKLYGQLVNSMLAFKAHSQQFFSDASKTLNPASAKQQDTLLQELRDIKQQQEQDKKRIKSLEDKIKNLDKKSSTRAGSSTPKKRKARKKEVSKKKSGSRSGDMNS